jgi:hypothetical protein
MTLLLGALYLGATIFLPWWVAVPLGILLATTYSGAPLSVLGGGILDATHGVTIPILGFAHVYTGLFLITALLVLVLRPRVAE